MVLGVTQWVGGLHSVVPLAQVLLVDFLLAVEVVLVLLEEWVPGQVLGIRLGELEEVLGEDPGLGLGVGLWVPGLVRKKWSGLVLGMGISSVVALYLGVRDTRCWWWVGIWKLFAFPLRWAELVQVPWTLGE